MNILLILHTYSANRELGSFAKELVKGFGNTGANIYVIKTNDLVDNLSARKYSKNINKKKFEHFFKKNKFDMVFTTNHGGVNDTLRKLVRGAPVISWMVDRNPFMHNGYLSRTVFNSTDHLITSSTLNVPSLIEKFNMPKGQVHYLPFMTNPNSFNRKRTKDINISFIGSYFLNERIISSAILKARGTKYERPLAEIIALLEEDFDLNEERLIKEKGLSAFLIAQGVTIRGFKGAVGNTLSNRKRLEFLSAVSDLGLKLFGTKNLSELIAVSPNISACFDIDYFVSTRERLVDIYDRSKIGLNINHHQATSGLGYRVFDIMSSSAVLVSNYQKQSDLDILFGKNHPIPIYKSKEELREICQFLLLNEGERNAISEQCQKLIGNRHTFDQRAVDIIKLAFPNFKPEKTPPRIKFCTQGDLWSRDSLDEYETTKKLSLLSLAYKTYQSKLVKLIKG